jgi:hypothetical protein
MKKNIHLLLFFLTVAFNNFTFCQKSNTPVMEFWNGGNLNVQFRFDFNSLDGGSGSGSFGRVISPSMGFGAASIFSNPSELALIKKPYLFFDSKFKIGLDLTSQLNDKIKSATDSFIKDTSTFIFNQSNYRKNTQVSQSDISNGAQLGTFAIAIPLFNNLVIGMGLNYPSDILLNLSGGGISTKLSSVKKVGDNNVNIDILLNPSIDNNFSFKMRELSFGAGSELFDNEAGKLIIGFSVNKYDVQQDIYLNETFDGMIVLYQSEEHHFNDPNDPNIDWANGETNNFFIRAANSADNSGIGFRFGFVYNPGGWIPELSNFNLIFSYDYVPKFILTDNNAYIESYQPKFFTGKLIGDKNDPLDILIDSLKISRPNLTVKTNNYFSQTTTFSFPSSLTIGVDAKLGEHTVALNFVKYMNEYSFQFDKYKIGKNLTAGLKLGASFRMPDELDGWNWAYLPLRLLYLDFDGMLMQLFSDQTHYKNSYYKISGGVLFGDAIVEGFNVDDTKSLTDGLNLPLPSGFALTREYNVFDYVNIGVLVFGFPDLALKFGIGIQF